MKKRIAWIAAVMAVVCLLSVSALAVTEAICEHKNTYMDRGIDSSSIVSEEFGHSFNYLDCVICSDCGLALSCHEVPWSESHDFVVIDTTSEELIDEDGFRTTHYITVKQCTVCGYILQVHEYILHKVGELVA